MCPWLNLELSIVVCNNLFIKSSFDTFTIAELLLVLLFYFVGVGRELKTCLVWNINMYLLYVVFKQFDYVI